MCGELCGLAKLSLRMPYPPTNKLRTATDGFAPKAICWDGEVLVRSIWSREQVVLFVECILNPEVAAVRHRRQPTDWAPSLTRSRLREEGRSILIVRRSRLPSRLAVARRVLEMKSGLPPRTQQGANQSSLLKKRTFLLSPIAIARCRIWRPTRWGHFGLERCEPRISHLT